MYMIWETDHKKGKRRWSTDGTMVWQYIKKLGEVEKLLVLTDRDRSLV